MVFAKHYFHARETNARSDPLRSTLRLMLGVNTNVGFDSEMALVCERFKLVHDYGSQEA